MHIVTRNPSNGPKRRAWVDIAVPLEPPENKRWRLPGRNWPVLRGRDIGSHSTMLHMYGEWAGKEVIEGNLDLLTEYQPLPFAPSAWVTDRIEDLVPNVILKQHNKEAANVPLVDQTLDLVEEGDARIVWRLRGRVEGTMLVFEAHAYIYSAQDGVRLECSFTNSDPSSPEIDETFEYIGIRTGEFFSMDYREHYNLPWPWRSPAPHWDWHQLIAQNKTLADGQQILFAGWLLCLPTPPNMGLDLTDPITRLRIDSLRGYLSVGNIALEGGDVWGLGDFSGSGQWQGFGVVPQIPKGDPDPGPRFRSIIAGTADQYDEKYGNLAKSAGQTGGQADFGASKGGACIQHQDPELVEELRYLVNEHFRPFHNRQTSGEPITKETNPKLWTWSQLPIGTTSPGPADDLGKGFDGPWPPWRQGTGYTGIDDQHRSQNTFNAAYALTGSHALGSLLHDFYQIDRTQVPNRIGAPRAVGRLFQTWASMMRLLPAVHRGVLQAHMWDRMKVVEKDWTGGHVPEDRPIRVIGTGSDPSLTNPDGSRKEAWIVWEHAIATMGFYAASLQTEGIHSDAYRRSAAHFARLVCEYGALYDGITWRCLTSVEYLRGAEEGNPVTYGVDSNQINIDDGFWEWTLPAVIISERLNRSDEAHRSRCQAIIDQVLGDAPPNWQASEWWAV